MIQCIAQISRLSSSIEIHNPKLFLDPTLLCKVSYILVLKTVQCTIDKETNIFLNTTLLATFYSPKIVYDNINHLVF